MSGRRFQDQGPKKDTMYPMDYYTPVGDDPLTSYFSQGFRDMGTLFSGGSYSDFTAARDQATNGFYSTITGSLPFIGNLHRSLLGRDQAEDYLDQNGLTWKDGQGYNLQKLTSSTSANLGSILSSGSRYLKNISNDLGKLYSSE